MCEHVKILVGQGGAAGTCTDFRDDLAVILAGQAGQLRRLLRANPVLASRFPVIIDFPRYTAGQLAAIFATLAGGAGFTLTPAAARKADAASAGHMATRLAAAPGWLSGYWTRPPPARPAGIRPPPSRWRRLRCARSTPWTPLTTCAPKTRPSSHRQTMNGQVSICS